MDKQPERKTIFDKELNEYKEEIILDINYQAIDPKIKGIPDLNKNVPREESNIIKPYSEEEVILEPNFDVIKPNRIGIAVRMDKGEIRFIESSNEMTYVGAATTEQIIDYNKALDAIKPDPKVIDFKRYAPRKERNMSPPKKSEEKKLNKIDMLSNIPETHSIDFGSLEEVKEERARDEKFTRYLDKEKLNNRPALDIKISKKTGNKFPLPKTKLAIISKIEQHKKNNATKSNEDLGPWNEENQEFNEY